MKFRRPTIRLFAISRVDCLEAETVEALDVHFSRVHELMARFTQALFRFVAQSTACNALHKVEQRLARWLLLAQDRMESDEFPLTQEFVAVGDPEKGGGLVPPWLNTRRTWLTAVRS
jgi:hypothetical protein